MEKISEHFRFPKHNFIQNSILSSNSRMTFKTHKARLNDFQIVKRRINWPCHLFQHNRRWKNKSEAWICLRAMEGVAGRARRFPSEPPYRSSRPLYNPPNPSRSHTVADCERPSTPVRLSAVAVRRWKPPDHFTKLTNILNKTSKVSNRQ